MNFWQTFIHAVIYVSTSCHGQIIFSPLYIPHFVFPFISWYVFRSFITCWSVRIVLLQTSCVHFYAGICFYFCCVCILVELLGHMATLCLVIRGALDCVPKCLYYFAFLLPVYEGFSFLHHFKASPDFFFFKSHCSFDFYSLDD